MKTRFIIASLAIISVPFFTVQPVGTRSLAVEIQPVVTPQVTPTTEALKPTPTPVIEPTPVVQEPTPAPAPVVTATDDQLFMYHTRTAFKAKCVKEVKLSTPICGAINKIVLYDSPEKFADVATVQQNLDYVFEYFRPGFTDGLIIMDLYNNFHW